MNTDTGGGDQPPASALAAEVEHAWAARALGEDRVVELGRYRLVRTVGRGGMGQVFEAWDTQLERHVAIKLVLRGGAQATLEEARCLARVAHPNVVCVHDVGRVDDVVYIAMELVDGPDLRRWLRDAPRDRLKILDVLISAGRGLAAVHDAGLLHGDVKPGNVLIGRDGRVRVADFGLARAEGPVADEATSKPELDDLVRRALAAVDEELFAEPFEPLDMDGVGPVEPALGRADWSSRRSAADWATPQLRGQEHGLDELRALLGAPSCEHAGGTVPYMAPERRLGCVGGPAGDQYSFCATAWEALFGAVPGPGAIPKPPRNRAWAAIEEVLRRGLDERPEARWPSMDALCSALQRVRDQQTRANHRPRMMAATMFTVAAFAGVATGMYISREQDPTVECERSGQAVWSRWNPPQRGALELRFAKSSLPLPRGEARFVIDRLDVWVDDWSTLWSRACVPESPLRRCLELEQARFEAVLSLIGSESGGDEALGVARALVTELGSPSACLDPDRGPSLDVAGIGRLAALSAIERRIELAVASGTHDLAAEELARFDATLTTLALVIDAAELEARRLAVEPLRARMLAANGEAGRARTNLREAIREAEARGDDRLRFALLLEQARLTARVAAGSYERESFGWQEPPLPDDDPVLREAPTVDDLAALEGLAERVEAGPVEIAELALIRAGMAIAKGSREARELDALILDLELAGEALSGPKLETYADLRLELALRRAQLHFAAEQYDLALRAAEQAQALADSDQPTDMRLWAAMTVEAISAAILGDCARVGRTVNALWGASTAGGLTLDERREELASMIDGVDWARVRRICSADGNDLEKLLTGR